MKLKCAPDLRSDFQRARIYQQQIERNANTPAVEIYAQLMALTPADMDVFPAIEDETGAGEGLIRRAERYGIDTRRLKTGLTPSLSL